MSDAIDPRTAAQARGLAAILARLEADPSARVIANMATGTGKTVLGMQVAATTVERGGRVLWVTHTGPTVTQARDEARRRFGAAKVGVVKAAHDHHGRRVTVASIQTLANPQRIARVLSAGPIALLVIDECHHAPARTYQALVDALPGVPVLGLTATCERSDQIPLGSVFTGGIAFSYGTIEAISDFALVTPVPDVVRVAGLVDLARSAEGLAEASAPEQESAKQRVAEETAAVAVGAVARGRKCVVFTVSVDQARRACAAAMRMGTSAVCVYEGQTRRERPAAERAYRRGNARAIFNCGVLTEGWDDPHTDCVVVAKTVGSISSLLQMVGRGLRRCDEIDKIDCEVIDLAGATGDMDLGRAWDIFSGRTSRAEESPVEREEREREERDAEIDKITAFVKAHGGVPVSSISALGAECVIEGCGRDRRTPWLCHTHAERARKGMDLKPPIVAKSKWRYGDDVLCAVGVCGRPAVAVGLCKTHYARKRRGAPLDAPVRSPAPRGKRTMCATGCGRIGDRIAPDGNRVCTPHLERTLLNAIDVPIRPPPLPGRRCTHHGCERRRAGDGLCQVHRKRFRAGEPMDAPIRARKKLASH